MDIASPCSNELYKFSYVLMKKSFLLSVSDLLLLSFIGSPPPSPTSSSLIVRNGMVSFGTSRGDKDYSGNNQNPEQLNRTEEVWIVATWIQNRTDGCNYASATKANAGKCVLKPVVGWQKLKTYTAFVYTLKEFSLPIPTPKVLYSQLGEAWLFPEFPEVFLFLSAVGLFWPERNLASGSEKQLLGLVACSSTGYSRSLLCCTKHFYALSATMAAPAGGWIAKPLVSYVNLSETL